VAPENAEKLVGNAVAAASAAPLPQSMRQVLDLSIALVAAHIPGAGAGALCDWRPEPPRPRALPQSAVVMNRPLGLSAGLFYSGVEAPSFAELSSFAAHPWGGVVLLQLPLTAGRPQHVQSTSANLSAESWYLVLCGSDDAGNAVVWDPATVKHDLEVPERGRPVAAQDARTRLRLGVLEDYWTRSRSGSASALLVALPPVMRRPI